ncbi:MAG: phosphotransferase family protein [Thermoleophilia bacterium]
MPGDVSPAARAWWLGIGATLRERAAADPATTIRDASGRNAAVVIAAPGRDGVVVKRGPRAARERRLIEDLARRVPDPGILPRVLPGDYPDTLVLAAQAGEADLWQLHTTVGRAPAALGAATGRALAALHRTDPPAGLGGDPPDVTLLHRPRPADMGRMTPATVRLIATVQATPPLAAGLDEVRDGWGGDTLIHGDVKWTNMLAPDVGDPGVVRLIDWESAAVGDAAWDVGAALSSYLSFWLGSIRPPDGAPSDPGALAAAAEHPLESLRPAMRALWEAYDTGSPPSRHRTVLCCAACLVRAAMNEAALRSTLSAHASLHLQVAANMMAAPAVAADRLLGLAA